ncbi:MAG: GGDEF domain-containing protein, partial [Acidobacteria bacterium]|nr:GGDEF domain-containing protein [Acidobacteriota bacterium]
MTVHEKIKELESRIAETAHEDVSPAQVDALNELSWEIKYTDSKRALELSRRAREAAEELVYLKGMGYALRNSAACHWFFAAYDDALSDALEALRLFEETHDDYGRAHAMNIVGNVHERLGNHSISLEFHRKSLQLRQEIGDVEGASTSLNNLGNVYSSFGEYANALNNYLEALRLYETIDNKIGISRALNNIGYIYTRLEDWDKALDHLGRALSLKQEIGDRQNEGLVLIHIGNVHECRGDYASALEHYTRGLRITQDVGDRQNEAAALNDIGNVYQELRDYQKALSYYTQSLQIAQEVGIKYYEIKALINLGAMLTKLKELRQAVAHLTKALAISEEIKSNDLIYRAHQSLSEAYELTGDLAQALRHQKAFHRSREQVFSEDSANKIKSVMIQTEIEKSQREAEIYRLKNVELARAYEDLHVANEQKSELVNQLKQQTEMLDRQTKEDGLTGLCNRRHFDSQLAQEFSRACRFKRELTVVMADIDHFKQINDRFSHQTGDEVIKAVGRLLRETCRMIDV